MKRKVKIELEETDEIIEREAKNFGGNASHVILPAKHRGKKILAICSNKSEIEESHNRRKK